MSNKFFTCVLLLITLFTNCRNASVTPVGKADIVVIYPTVGYLDLQLDPGGALPANPYFMEFENGKKKIVFCGVNHLPDYSDTNHPMLRKIDSAFFAFRPDIAVNEGGDVSGKHYGSKREAIITDGEIGLTKILCDSLHIKTVDGAPPATKELAALAAKYTKGEVLAYIATERLMWALKGQGIRDSAALTELYTKFLKGYFISNAHVELTSQEQSFQFFTSNYRAITGRPFNLDVLEPTNPFIDSNKFQEIGRASKQARDQFLLTSIDHLLDTYDKVFVVFGGWHLLTCKPGLEQIIKRKR